ncbi:hypothetical protein AB0D58_31495 [Streptomyces sp. NPDC048210]|uniref:hypothetical protein n=1 Tax=Streptomyces sp. NPDC048210 TaxID=3156657 RepID=UPI003423C945
MAELYAFFDPNGHLMFSDEAQARMCEAADPHHKSPLAFSIHRSSWGGDGLQGHVGKSSCFVAPYPPNPIATRVVTALGGPTQYIFGNLTICGTRWSAGDKQPSLRGLSKAQQDLLMDVHAVVCEETVGASPQG